MVTSKAPDVTVLSTGAAFQEQQSVLQAIPATQTPHEHTHSTAVNYCCQEWVHTQKRKAYTQETIHPAAAKSKKECSMS